MNADRQLLNTSAVDLFSPGNGFVVASNLYGRLHRWWLLLRKYWWMPVIIFVALPGSALVLSLLSGPTYESKACMWVTGKINVSESWSYTEELVNFLGTQAALLQSPAIQKRALAKLRAESDPGGEQAVAGRAKKAPMARSSGTDSTVGDQRPAPFPFRVKVLEGAKSSTLELRATGKNAASTRKFLDCLMGEFLNFKRESRELTSTQASSSLGTEATRLKGELRQPKTNLRFSKPPTTSSCCNAKAAVQRIFLPR